MEGHNIPARLRELKQQQASKRPGARAAAGRGILASIAVKSPVTPAPRPALPAAPPPAAPAPAPEVKQEDPKKKLFQHRI
jgi:hypothetical protein